jgi:type I restriction enzyme S subunit
MDEWQVVALGEVTDQAVESVSVEPGVAYPLLGVRWYGLGAFLRETVDSTTSKARILYWVTPGQFIYNRLFAYKGSFGLVTPELSGSYVSNEFPLFACDTSRLLPEYLSLYFQQPGVWSEVETESTGTTASRSRWKEARFDAHRIALPPLDVQRRIVDLVGALDANIASLQTEAANLLTALAATLDLSFPRSVGGRPLSDLVTARSGPSWAASDETSEPVAGATPVVKITNTRPDGSFDTKQLAYVRDLPPSTTTLNTSSIVVIRTNGNRARIGNAYIPPVDVFGSAVSAFQFHVQVTEPGARDYVYWFLRAPRTQAAMSAAASGTTGLGNLALKTLRALEVPWPDEPTRDDVCITLRQLQDAANCLQAERDALRGVRSALLPALLSGHLEVPESYDELVGAL